MEKVIVYTTTHCPYCKAAKTLLNKWGVKFDEVLIAEDDDKAWDQLTKKSGMQTVPQIFIGERLIGGYQELAKTDPKFFQSST